MRSIEACERGDWSILTWRKDDGQIFPPRPFRCKSWRHEGECRLQCGACDFMRITHALSSFTHWTYAVLTYPQKDWPDVEKLFRFGVVSWSRMRKRITREFGDFKYIQTWEAHKNGYPHVNVALSSAAFYAAVGPDGPNVPRRWFGDMAKECGFGRQASVSQLRSKGAVAGYLVKLGMELAGAAKKGQVPVLAPRHFRRLRASRKTLPPRLKDDTITGQLFRLAASEVAKRLGLDQDKGDQQC